MNPEHDPLCAYCDDRGCTECLEPHLHPYVCYCGDPKCAYAVKPDPEIFEDPDEGGES